MKKIEVNLPLILKPITAKLVRFGGPWDGAYYLTGNLVQTSKFVVSMGVWDDWSFESSLRATNKNLKFHLVDGSIGISQYFKLVYKNLFFCKFRSALHYTKVIVKYIFDFLVLKNYVHLKKFVGPNTQLNYISLSNLVNINTEAPETILKVDIEGNEYRILDDIVGLKKRFSAVLIEFHDVDLHLMVIEKFLEGMSGFKLVVTKANNVGGIGLNQIPMVIELSLINEEVYSDLESVVEDAVLCNNPLFPDFSITYS